MEDSPDGDLISLVDDQPQQKRARKSRPSQDHALIEPEELAGLYQLGDYIGSGSYGSVYKARCLRTKKTVAIKKVSVNRWLLVFLTNCTPQILNPFNDATNAKRLLREIKILRMLQHPCIIGFLGIIPPATPDFNALLIVFEFVLSFFFLFLSFSRTPLLHHTGSLIPISPS